MKFKGVAGSKHPTLRKGDVIEYSPEEKVLLMAKDGVSDNSPDGWRHIPTKASLIGGVQVVKGRTGTGKEDEVSQYIGSAEVSYRPLRLIDDTLFREKLVRVKVHIKDSKNDIGVPDLESVSYETI